jgi:hypothetical protein
VTAQAVFSAGAVAAMLNNQKGAFKEKSQAALPKYYADFIQISGLNFGTY